MEAKLTILYIISTILIFICTIQRSKTEEMFTEYDTILLPFLTISGISILYISMVFININIINLVLLGIFCCLGFISTVSNLLYFYELAEYTIETDIFNEDVSSAEFSEILITVENEKKEKKVEKVKKRKFSLKKKLNKYFCQMKNKIKNMTLEKFLVYILSFFIILVFLITRDEILTELISISICFCTVREVKLDSIITGYIHLSILFVYDCVWILFGDEMGKLSEGIKVPIRLKIPGQVSGYDMVGMGDIFIPALFISIVKKYGEKKNLPSIYWVSFFGFCLSMGFVIAELWISENPKPALMFICPILGAITAAYATMFGNFHEFVTFKRDKPKKKASS